MKEVFWAVQVERQFSPKSGAIKGHFAFSKDEAIEWMESEIREIFDSMGCWDRFVYEDGTIERVLDAEIARELRIYGARGTIKKFDW